MTVSLRHATPTDRDFLWQLHIATMKCYVEQTWGWDHQWQQQEFERKFDPQGLQVIQSCETPIGCLSVRHEPDHVFLASIEIDPDHQNRGMGTRLIKQIIEEAEDEGRPVRLLVLKVNPARALYERLGFRRVDETETHYRMVRDIGNPHR